MTGSVEIRILPKYLEDHAYLLKKLSTRLGVSKIKIRSWRIIKRSIDARKSPVKYVLRVQYSTDTLLGEGLHPIPYEPVSSDKKVVIVGAGPAGYFAALRCIELGLQPLVLDRGKDVRARRRDLRQIQQFHNVNPDSNYCFGEGGAGTYSDGKLYTRAHKRGNVEKVLQILVQHGANRDILIDAHPHIGSNKLPGIIAAIRETIVSNGGEVHFDSCVKDFIVRDRRILGVLTDERSFLGAATILATGHSARDVYSICSKHEVSMTFKPFALGVRIEHPQRLIDEVQYRQADRDEHLPAAAYRLACQIKNRGVFSFCMCPGGLIVPTATAPGELVVNGMSLSKRDSPYANSGLVSAIDQNPGNDPVFGGMMYQKQLEQAFFNFGDGSQKAPAQRIPDFITGKISSDLPSSSYIPGIYSAPLHQLLPADIYHALREALQKFDQKMKGYITAEGQVIGLESRTSAPVRIVRDDQLCMSPMLRGLFPAGEGAGYAGGILSAALDGERVADATNAFLQ